MTIGQSAPVLNGGVRPDTTIYVPAPRRHCGLRIRGSVMTSELPVIYPPHPNPRHPEFALPPDTCDAHFHIFGPPDRFPYADTRVYTPPAAPLEHFQNLMEILGTERGVVVQPNAHGLDNSVSLDAIARAGGRFRGVAKVDDSFSETDLEQLHDGGIRGVRFNLIAELGGKPNLPMYERVIERITPLGWSAAAIASL